MHQLGDGLAWDWRTVDEGVQVTALEADLPFAVLSQNERERMNWRERHRQDAELAGWVKQLFGQAITRSGASPAQLAFPWPAVDIEFVFRFARPTRRDVTNYLAGCKPLIDAVTIGPRTNMGVGILKDDSYIYLDSVTGRVQRHLEHAPSTIMRVSRCRH